MIITDITSTSCSALTAINGVNHRRAYVNSPSGRAEFMADCAGAENYAQVLAAWGDTPTVDEPEIINPEPTEPAGPTVEQRLAAVEDVAAAHTIAILEGGANNA